MDRIMPHVSYSVLLRPTTLEETPPVALPSTPVLPPHRSPSPSGVYPSISLPMVNSTLPMLMTPSPNIPQVNAAGASPSIITQYQCASFLMDLLRSQDTLPLPP